MSDPVQPTVLGGDGAGVEPRARRRRGGFWLKAAVSLALLALVLATADLREVWRALRRAELSWVGLALLLNLVGGALTATRWQGLLASQGVHAPLRRLVESCVVAAFFRQFLPSTVGGDAIRVYDSWRLGASKRVALSTLVVDRLFGLFAMLAFAVGAIAFSPALLSGLPASLGSWALAGAGLLAATLVAVFFLPAGAWRWLGSPPLPEVVQRLGRGVAGSLDAFRGRHGLVLRSLFLSVVLVANVVVFYFLIGRAMGFGIPFAAYFVIVPISALVMMAPLSINGIGIREGIFVLLLGSAGVPVAEAVAFAWIEYALYLVYGLLGGIVYSLRPESSRAARRA